MPASAERRGAGASLWAKPLLGWWAHGAEKSLVEHKHDGVTGKSLKLFTFFEGSL
jgi:hypothetical protein